MTPKWIGIRVSAVISILGSLFSLLFAALMLLAAWLAPVAPDGAAPQVPMKPFAMVMAGLCVLLAVWGITTAVGLFRRRGWSRISILVFSTFLTLFSGVGVLMAFAIPLPETPGVDPQVMAGTRLAVACGYGGLVLLGTWWLVLFNLNRSKSYFTGTHQVAREGGRPLSISVLAWYLLMSSLFILPMGLIRLPSMFFGLLLTGWAALMLYCAFTVAQVCLGVGLLRLREWARIGTIAYFCMMAANGLAGIAPSRQQELTRALRVAWPWLNQPGQETLQTQLNWPIFVVFLLIAGLPVYFLHRRKAAFQAAT